MNSLAQGRPIDRSRLQPSIVILVHDIVVRRIFASEGAQSQMLWPVMSRFLDRANLSFGKTRTINCPMINDKAFVHILA
jgi:hypothetical protein